MTNRTRVVWTAGLSYVLGKQVEPKLENGFVYEATTAGAAGSAEPTWPVIVGNTVTDGTVVWTCRQVNWIQWTAHAIYKSGAVEPVWPTNAGDTIVDGNVTWTCKAQQITDVYCPNSKQVLILASKVWAGDRDVTRFCATNDPTDWTSSEDAGFLSHGLQAVGEQECSALGEYRGNLCIWTPSTLIIYQVDPDPSQNAKLDAFEGLGTTVTRGASSVANDLDFLSAQGARSVSVAAGGQNLEAGDFGAPVDPLVKAFLAAHPDAIGAYFANRGQYLIFFGTDVMVFTRSAISGTACWSRYTLPWTVDDVALLGGKLYVRSGDAVFIYDEDAFCDQDINGNNVIFDTIVWWPWLDFGKMGVTKELIGLDYTGARPVTIEVGYDQTNLALFTAPLALDADTVPGGIIPMPLSAPSFSIRITHSENAAWSMDAIIVYLQDDLPTT